MPEAVIVSTARSPIGRANKGSLTEVPARRPDRHHRRRRCSTRSRSSTAPPIEDLILGCGQPAGEAGYNIARVAAILAGLADVPGVTVNRYCSSSLQTIRMAAHAIKAGEGDVFIAAGVETVSRFLNGFADSGPHNPLVRRRRGPHRRARHGRRRLVDAARGPARHLHRHGPDRRERAPQAENVAREEHGRVRRPARQQRAVGQPGERLLGAARSRRSRTPTGTVGHQGRRPPRRHHRREAGRAQAGRSGPTARSPPATPARSTTAPPP